MNNTEDKDIAVEFLARVLCDSRWGVGTYAKGGKTLNRAYWRRKARKQIQKNEALMAECEKLRSGYEQHD